MTDRQLVIGMPVIDGTQWMGGAIYVRNLIYCLAALPADRRPRVRLLGNVDPDSAYVSDLARLSFVEVPSRRIGRAERIQARLARWLPGDLGQPRHLTGIDVVFPSFVPTPPSATPVHWIPDFQHAVLPHFFSEEERARRDASIRAVAHSSGTLVLSSYAAEADFRAFAPGARVRVAIWRFCTVLTENEEGGTDARGNYGLPERYIYLPNQFWAHKNHAVAFEALALLANRGLRPTLVCTGQEQDSRNAQHMPMLRALLRERGLEAQVRFLGLVPRADQVAIFRSASFVLQPSLFEGWSTVVEDAKALGRPMVLSDLPVHREQVEEGGPDFQAILFDPRDPAALADALATAWERFPSGEVAGYASQARSAAERRRAVAAERILEILTRARAAGTRG